ncbi:MAG: nucleotide exchange factor GrpE [Gemmatimonadetes bacterium]|nr:nucleotide exchange factor GrpE [Gemmatimonadota bacterium]
MQSSPAEGEGGGSDTGISGDPVAEWKAAYEEQRDKYLRLAADHENFRKRAAKERLEAGVRGQGELIGSLVELLDDLGRFSQVDPSTTDARTVVDGVSMVEKKAMKALTTQGLEVVNPVDQPFDPALHDAVATEPAESEGHDQTVARVYQCGYVFKGQMLRPARVVVRQWNG